MKLWGPNFQRCEIIEIIFFGCYLDHFDPLYKNGFQTLTTPSVLSLWMFDIHGKPSMYGSKELLAYNLEQMCKDSK